MKFTLLAAVALTLPGCSPPSDATGPAEAAHMEVALALPGTYEVTAVNGQVPDIRIDNSQPIVTIDAERINFRSQCIYHDWTYSYEGEALTTRRYTYPDTGGVVAMCARGLMPGEQAIIAAIGGATEMRRVRGGVWLSGEKGSVQLRRIPSDNEVADRAVDLRGSWNVIALDGQPFVPALPLEADFESIWWEPGCAGQGTSYNIEGDRFSTPPPHQFTEVCDIGVPPGLDRIFATLRQAERIVADRDGTVMLTGDRHSLQLIRRTAGEEGQ